VACDTRVYTIETEESRKADVKAATERLTKLIREGKVRATLDRATGAVAFTGWSAADRARLSDGCAIRLLRADGTVQAAIRAAEGRAGRKADLSSTVHSHDGGKSWGPGH
jgi:hypothetical protein